MSAFLLPSQRRVLGLVALLGCSLALEPRNALAQAAPVAPRVPPAAPTPAAPTPAAPTPAAPVAPTAPSAPTAPNAPGEAPTTPAPAVPAAPTPAPAAPVAPAAPSAPAPLPAPGAPAAPSAPAPVPAAPVGSGASEPAVGPAPGAAAAAEAPPTPGYVSAPGTPTAAGATPTGSEPLAPVAVAPLEAPLPAQASAATPGEAAPIEVTIVGTRNARVPGSAQVIRSKELERFEYDDVTAVLAAVPGVYSRTEDGMGLRPNIGLRGVNPDRSKKVTLMEDGVLFGPAPYSAPAAYYFPVITRMSQVRVVKGPGSVAYGPQTVAGAIDLITRPIPGKPAGTLDLALGQFGYAKGHGQFGASNEQFGFLVEGVRLQNSGFKELPRDADTGVTRNEWMAKFFYVVDPSAKVRNEFRLKLGYSDEVSNETYLGLSDQDFKANPYQRYGATALDRMKNHRFSTALTHQVDFTPHMSLTTTAYRQVFSRTWRRVDSFRGRALFDTLAGAEPPAENRTAEEESRADYLRALRGQGDLSALGPNAALQLATNARDFVSEGIETRYRWDTETGDFSHRLEVGLRLHYDRIERRHTSDGFDLFEGEPYPNGTATQTSAFNKGATYALSPHVLYAVSWRALTITPGVRAELLRQSFIDRATGDGLKAFNYAVLPGIGAYYALTDELGLLAGAYRGFSPTPPENSKDSEPEYSINYEAGTRYTDGPLRAELIGFFNDYSNLTNYCTSSGGGCPDQFLDQQSSAGHAQIWGIEALAAHDVPAGPVKLPLSVSYTYTKAQFGRSFSSFDPSWGDVQKGDPIPYVPSHQLRASAGVEGKPAGGAVAFTYVAAMPEGSVGSGEDHIKLETDAQYLVDASLWAKVWGPFSLYGTVQNLLDSTYLVARRPFGARPNAPRWMHVGVKAAF